MVQHDPAIVARLGADLRHGRQFAAGEEAPSGVTIIQRRSPARPCGVIVARAIASPPMDLTG
jgi:hypothetical protein